MHRPAATQVVEPCFTASLARKRTSAGVLFTNAAGHILLVQPNYKPYWDLPGGHVEEGESPMAAAEREVKEELGLKLPIGRVLVVDFVPPRPDLVEALMFVFDGGILEPHISRNIAINTDELTSWRWCTPRGTAAMMADAPMLNRRVTAARRAKAAGAMCYLESGWHI